MKPTPQKKLVYDISASTIQVIVSQLSGAVLFLLLSNYLSKPDIGIINWSLAVLTIAYALLGFGMDQVVVKKIAMGENATSLLSTYLTHVILFGLLFITGILICFQFISSSNNNLAFVLLALSQLFLFFSVPFKQVVNGAEKFSSLLLMSVCANTIRVLGLLALMLIKNVSVLSVVYLYLFSSIIELIVCIVAYAITLRSPIQVKWNRSLYTSLVRSSLPQAGVVFFTAVIARIDWILLGLLSTSAVVADYSFTYRAFELFTTPLLVLGMLLLPKISKLFSVNRGLTTETNSLLIHFVGREMLIAVFTMLILQVGWVPVMDRITNGKYGAHNSSLIFILSLATPFLYINNMLWSLDFAQGKLKSILYVFLITCVVNIIADLLLIPAWGANGAATGFCIAIITQTGLYFRTTTLKYCTLIFRDLLIAVLAAATAVCVATNYFDGAIGKILVSTAIYLAVLLITKRIAPGKNSFLHSFSKI